MLTLPNDAGPVAVELTIALPALCEIAHEPQSGSTLTWRYTAGDALLEIKAARQWPSSQMAEPLDLETFTRRAAEQASAARWEGRNANDWREAAQFATRIEGESIEDLPLFRKVA